MTRQLLAVLFLLMICVSADARDSYYDYDYQYHLQANIDHHKIAYGYYPYHFSNDARSRYSYSAEEKGHYIDGLTDKEWPFAERRYKFEIIETSPDDGVLVSLPSEEQVTRLDKEVRQAMALAKQKDMTPRVNEMRDINKVIAKHKWTFESKAMADAVRAGSNAVHADSTDYDALFQVK